MTLRFNIWSRLFAKCVSVYVIIAYFPFGATLVTLWHFVLVFVDSACGISTNVNSASRGSNSSKGSKLGKFFDSSMIASNIPGLA